MINIRSIGKKNINLVKKLTREAIKKRQKPYRSILEITCYQGIDEEIIDKLPVELWDTWEMADQEIRRIINDTLEAF